MARTPKKVDEIELLETRVVGIEDMLKELLTSKTGERHAHAASNGCCSLPTTPRRQREGQISDFREGLIAYTEKKWVNGTTLRYYFFDTPQMKGNPENVKLVRDAFAIWRDLGIGLEFRETKDISEAELRIAFQPGIGSWSYVGTDNLKYPGQHEPTMNFGWDLRQDPRGIDTPLHEIGHAIGFPHEHQNPFAGIVWDEEEVIRHFSGSPNYWDVDRIRHNILNKHSQVAVVGSGWDPDSVMHYSFESGLILHPSEYQNGLTPAPGLSDVDKSEVLKFYPPLEPADIPTLQPFEAEPLDIAPSEQKNLLLTPAETRTYSIRTIGAADTLVVLFRRDDDGEVYVAASDDAGTDRNARIDVRLERGASYVLRVRLLSRYGSGSPAVLYW